MKSNIHEDDFIPALIKSKGPVEIAARFLRNRFSYDIIVNKMNYAPKFSDRKKYSDKGDLTLRKEDGSKGIIEVKGSNNIRFDDQGSFTLFNRSTGTRYNTPVCNIDSTKAINKKIRDDNIPLGYILFSDDHKFIGLVKWNPSEWFIKENYFQKRGYFSKISSVKKENVKVFKLDPIDLDDLKV